MPAPNESAQRLVRARESLEGLSVGDAFGGFYEMATVLPHALKTRTLPSAPWRFTDDTNMALSIFESLRQEGRIDQDKLAASFAEHFDRLRGYGMGARALMNRMRDGANWRDIAGEMFGGGSYGNGGAMRVALLGAYFADDINVVIEQARLSAEVTHAHPEGIAGAIAVAVATAIAWQARQVGERPTRAEFIEGVISYMPESEVRSGLRRARDLVSTEVEHVIGMIGNGYKVSAQDTVPFALWCAGEHLDNYEEAIWLTASGLGDVDTNCAIVGGIVAAYTGSAAIPAEWLQRREPLPEWAFNEE